MAVNKNFVVKNGLEVNQELILADATTDRVGIGTTVPHYKLHVNGGIGATFANITGIATANVAIVENLQGSYLNFSGVSTISTLYGDTAEYNTFYGDVGIVTFVTTSGVSTVETQFNVGVGGTVLTAFVNAGIGSVGIGTQLPEYQLDIRSRVSTGETALYVQGDARITGDLNLDDIFGDQATFNFVNVAGFTTTADLFVSGIGSITSYVGLITNLNGTNLNYSGISTISTLYGDTAEYNTFYGDVGIITSLSGTDINYTGISTFGDVKIYSGIITSSSPSGIVTYYGDGKYLENVSISVANNDSIVATGVTILNFDGPGVSAITSTSAGISTITIIASLVSDTLWRETTAGIHTLSKVGIGTTNPTQQLSVKGTIEGDRVLGVHAVNLPIVATGDYGLLSGSPLYDAFGVSLSGVFDCLIEPTGVLAFTDLGTFDADGNEFLVYGRTANTAISVNP